jgi:hypothetical protein
VVGFDDPVASCAIASAAALDPGDRTAPLSSPRRPPLPLLSGAPPPPPPRTPAAGASSPLVGAAAAAAGAGAAGAGAGAATAAAAPDGAGADGADTAAGSGFGGGGVVRPLRAGLERPLDPASGRDTSSEMRAAAAACVVRTHASLSRGAKAQGGGGRCARFCGGLGLHGGSHRVAACMRVCGAGTGVCTQRCPFGVFARFEALETIRAPKGYRLGPLLLIRLLTKMRMTLRMACLLRCAYGVWCMAYDAALLRACHVTHAVGEGLRGGGCLVALVGRVRMPLSCGGWGMRVCHAHAGHVTLAQIPSSPKAPSAYTRQLACKHARLACVHGFRRCARTPVSRDPRIGPLCTPPHRHRI